MDAATDIFCVVAREEFAFLVSDFGFTANASVDVHWSQVNFDSERVTIGTWWDYRDGTDVAINAKVDTFWIRPASPHGSNIQDLLQMVAPAVLIEFPQVSSSAKTEENLRPILAFYAKQLTTECSVKSAPVCPRPTGNVWKRLLLAGAICRFGFWFKNTRTHEKFIRHVFLLRRMTFGCSIVAKDFFFIPTNDRQIIRPF